MKTGIIALIVAVIVIAGGAVLVMKKNNQSTSTTPATTQNTTNTPATTNNSNTGSDQSNPNGTAVTTITYSDSGFSPSSVTVKSGSTVEIKNTSSHAMQFDSDPHPIHTDDTDLNVGEVAAGKSMTFVANKKGTFGYHNHLNPSEKGTIIVQ